VKLAKKEKIPAALLADAMRLDRRIKNSVRNDADALESIKNNKDYDELKDDLFDLFNNCSVE